jgi:dipeptidyl aminopeptidase/acylaminoacyl peptidase
MRPGRTRQRVRERVLRALHVTSAPHPCRLLDPIQAGRSPSSERAGGTHTRRLAVSAEGDRAPSWSPNGKTIAFARGERIYLMGADGRHPHALITSPGVRDADPAWSPDGTRIAFVRREAGLGAALFLRAPAWKPVRS